MKISDKTYFTNAEVSSKVGMPVQALVDLRHVPKGTKGIVVKAKKHSTDEWSAQVEWRLPRNTSWITVNSRTQFVVPRDRVKMTFNKSEFSSSVVTPTDGWDGMPTHGDRKYTYFAIGSAAIAVCGFLFTFQSVAVGLILLFAATIVFLYSISMYSNSKGLPKTSNKDGGT